MNPTTEMRLAILTDLAHLPEGYLAPESSVRTVAKLSAAIPQTATEISDVIASLEREGLIISQRIRLTGELRYAITPLGRVELKSAVGI